MPISITVVTEPDRLKDLENIWNRFIHENTTNPFFLVGFIDQMMAFRRSKGWFPTTLLLFVDRAIVGIAPLMIKTKFGLRSARFLLGQDLSPDFILEASHREACIERIVDYTFEVLRCQFLNLTLPGESPNFDVLTKVCRAKGICARTIGRASNAHSVLRIQGTWEEFLSSKGHSSRKRIKKVERKIPRNCKWKVVCYNNPQQNAIIQKIESVERTSWKEQYRRATKRTDASLYRMIRGSMNVAKTEPDFQWRVYFLELNGEPISYVLVTEYRGNVIFAKTSYNQKYEKITPGLYVMNYAIREIFDEGKTSTIDFLTRLRFHRTWTTAYLLRVNVLISRMKVLTILTAFLMEKGITRRILSHLLEW